MNINHLSSFILLLQIFTTTALLGQDENSLVEEKMYLISMNENKLEYVGYIKNSTSDSLWVEVNGRTKSLSQENIRSIEHYDFHGRYFSLDRNFSRHVLAPTAMNLNKGQIYYQNLMLAGNLFSGGVTDHFSLAGGFIIPPIIDEDLFWYFAPKVSGDIAPNFHIGFGVIAAGIYELNRRSTDEVLIVPFANFTAGNRDRNVTFGIGYGLEGEELDSRILAGMLGVTFRFSEKFCFVSENTFAQNTTIFNERSYEDLYYLGAQTIRFIKRKNTIDFGVMIISEGYIDLIPIPYLGYVRYF